MPKSQTSKFCFSSEMLLRWLPLLESVCVKYPVRLAHNFYHKFDLLNPKSWNYWLLKKWIFTCKYYDVFERFYAESSEAEKKMGPQTHVDKFSLNIDKHITIERNHWGRIHLFVWKLAAPRNQPIVTSPLCKLLQWVGPTPRFSLICLVLIVHGPAMSAKIIV